MEGGACLAAVPEDSEEAGLTLPPPDSSPLLPSQPEEAESGIEPAQFLLEDGEEEEVQWDKTIFAKTKMHFVTFSQKKFCWAKIKSKLE